MTQVSGIGITQEQYNEKLQEGYNSIPIFIKIDQTFDMAQIYELFCPDPQKGGLLESGRRGRYSYVSFTGIATIQSKNGFVQKQGNHLEGLLSKNDDPLDSLEELMSHWKSPIWKEGPDWQGGALGFLSYDLVQHIEDIPNQAHDDLQIPDLLFTIYRDVIATDHHQKATFLITNVLPYLGEDYHAGMNRLVAMKEKLLGIMDKSSTKSFNNSTGTSLMTSPSFTKEKFEQAVIKIQDYIKAGDVFQVNLSVRQDFSLTTTPWSVYNILRKINPSPYMGYLHYADYQIVCGSPELLIKIEDQKISTRPIAGTRPRGNNREEDLKLAQELIDNEKERAEHIMLVDLERNDLGRVCRYGTVQVTDLMVIEEYSHVMHIVSHIEGELAQGKTAYDAIRASFPGGTITGAPKVRTMEIIEELEPVRRGLYTGAIGWIGFNGDLELNIVIRTLLAKEGKGYVQAGAGVVIDSEPEAEYYESLKKAEALLKSVEISQGINTSGV